jgi:hypothetical protein
MSDTLASSLIAAGSGSGSRPTRGRNLAIAEWPTTSEPADYALFVGTDCIGVVEAKRRNKNVSSFIDQAQRYSRMRARAVGFVYSWSRLSTVFTSLMIGFFLDRFGPPGVFGFIAANMAVVCISIGVFGPRTRDLALEEVV